MPSYQILHGDCLQHLRTLPTQSIDSLVTDPPAGIGFQAQGWDSSRGGRNQWVAWMTEVMTECLRVLKPGAHALVWAIPRTAHWTATAVEDAGFEIRDVVSHFHGQGFPKSLDVGSAIDKAAGATREVIGTKYVSRILNPGDLSRHTYAVGLHGKEGMIDVTAPSTDAAKQWQGWGTALKPAREDWILARKPLEGTVAHNIQQYGTGALNIKGSQVGDGKGLFRYPANVTLSHSQDCGPPCSPNCAVLKLSHQNELAPSFFYVAKATASERQLGCSHLYWDLENRLLTEEEWRSLPPEKRKQGNIHATIKPVALMQWLTKLVTPPRGKVLDPFAGSGTTGVACLAEGFHFTGIEAEEAHVRIMEARLAVVKPPDEEPTWASGGHPG